ncbi:MULTISPECIES: DUF6301 family protein [unclassified Rhodococcus (in: high G+C Gram-positive bacteria)]|jgi:hypothetical protein|uniref:DUF6301 family protein n=1 Tax=unclassified Rhodococcus (in: high G+C Gram-positive bacteria) TaxID=192944 RepID=UPI000BD8CC83|nr:MULTISPECIES: DUF6301 family protein [unclassified Rhodococcus (in: high G+C Gram-positive bacteria)]MBP1158236.1 hypothetical protein [Rhodococcus sp. PvR099]PTR43674.1 hypothetical protein C8K38_10624 [Rhodococcus sp. OK611]SNX90492.1 hypothetical protein SAMN05447004_10624 [Rhodococcus sp. OK270]
MHADIEGAVRTARLAAHFDWTWDSEDLERFCAAAGWQAERFSDNAATLTTNLDINRRSGDASLIWGPLQIIRLWVTDVADPGTRMPEVMAELLGELSVPMAAEFGEGTPVTSGIVKKLRWDLPNVVIILSAGLGSVAMRLVSPKHQAWTDEPEDEWDDDEDEDDDD